MTSQNPDLKLAIEQAYENGVQESNPRTLGEFIPEFTSSPHPRFLGLAQSIRERKGEKVKILSPLFIDSNTSTEPTETEPYPGFIYMDAMHFGMGNSCLQITYETQNINHGRYLYDMLIPFTPVISALSLASPIFKSKLSAHDFRFEVIEQSVDCRTKEETDPKSLHYLPKSRYSPVSLYISDHQFVLDADNDTPFNYLD